MRRSPRLVLLAAIAVFALFAAACSDDTGGGGDGGGTPSTAPDAAGDADADPGDQAVDPDNDVEADDNGASDEGDLPLEPVAGPDIDTMVAEANADGEVTAEEITGILEASGTAERQAGCEGALLAELGITDPTSLDELRAAAPTQEQLAALQACITG